MSRKLLYSYGFVVFIVGSALCGARPQPRRLHRISAVSFGNSAGWTSPVIVGLFVNAVGLGTTFIWRERHCPSPMLDLGLFKRVPFSAGIASGLLSYLVLFGTLGGAIAASSQDVGPNLKAAAEHDRFPFTVL
jgi:hypothetical protein